ncbi:MAG: 30S ribosomal protein S16 [Patescibacteria group bacterium]
MLAIKLKLAGKKHQRMFRVVVAEKKSKLQGRYVDDLGFWNPHSNKFSLNEEKTKKWLKEGVRPTDTAHNLLVKAGIIKGHKIAVHKKSKKPQETGKTAAVVSATEQVVEEATANGVEEKPSVEEIISEPVVE